MPTPSCTSLHLQTHALRLVTLDVSCAGGESLERTSPSLVRQHEPCMGRLVLNLVVGRPAGVPIFRLPLFQVFSHSSHLVCCHMSVSCSGSSRNTVRARFPYIDKRTLAHIGCLAQYASTRGRGRVRPPYTPPNQWMVLLRSRLVYFSNIGAGVQNMDAALMFISNPTFEGLMPFVLACPLSPS